MSNTKKLKPQKTVKQNKSELNLNIINQANENSFPTKEIEIIVGDKPYLVVIDTVFKTTKIEKMIKSLVKSENIKKFEEFDESVKLSYYMYLLIKTFTNLDIPDKLSFEQEINLISSLIDLGIYEKVMAEFSEDEIKKVNDFLHKFNLNLNDAIKEMNKDNEIEVSIVEDELGGQVE
ncbi:MAG: hypothetical protein M0Q94_14990 [Candidatus Cloacimonetes bacterium]|nr:hypothetical protein [Candidatus Cloacimonadota bacterium]